MCDMNTAGMAHGGWGCTLERSGREHVRRRAALVSKAPDLREVERSIRVAWELGGRTRQGERKGEMEEGNEGGRERSG